MSNFIHEIVFGSSLVNIAAALTLLAGMNKWRRKYYNNLMQHIEDYKKLLEQHKEMYNWYLTTKTGRMHHYDD